MTKKANPWIQINLEKRRQTMLKSNPGEYITLSNVTHFKERSHGFLLKCHQGVVYFEKDDISHIISDCDDWIV